MKWKLSSARTCAAKYYREQLLSSCTVVYIKLEAPWAFTGQEFALVVEPGRVSYYSIRGRLYISHRQ